MQNQNRDKMNKRSNCARVDKNVNSEECRRTPPFFLPTPLKKVQQKQDGTKFP